MGCVLQFGEIAHQSITIIKTVFIIIYSACAVSKSVNSERVYFLNESFADN